MKIQFDLMQGLHVVEEFDDNALIITEDEMFSLTDEPASGTMGAEITKPHLIQLIEDLGLTE